MIEHVVSFDVRRRLKDAVRDAHLAFLIDLFGLDAVDPDDRRRVIEAGLAGATPKHQDVVAVAVGAGSASGFGYHHRVSAGDSPESTLAIVIRARMISAVKALGQRLDSELDIILADVDDVVRRHRLSNRSVRSRSEEARRAAYIITRKISTLIGDLKRDWFRVVHTESHNAIEEAKAETIVKQFGSDARVFKRPRSDACSYCKLLYLKPDGVTPRVFRLGDLIAAGTNVGRRAGRPSRSGKSRTEWRATVGSTHPFCRCTMSLLTADTVFDDRGRQITAVRKAAVEVERVVDPSGACGCRQRSR